PCNAGHSPWHGCPCLTWGQKRRLWRPLPLCPMSGGESDIPEPMLSANCGSVPIQKIEAAGCCQDIDKCLAYRWGYLSGPLVHRIRSRGKALRPSPRRICKLTQIEARCGPHGPRLLVCLWSRNTFRCREATPLDLSIVWRDKH